MLAGCGLGQGDNLDQFFVDALSEAQTGIKPLPEVKQFKPFEYNADGLLQDPFSVRKAKVINTLQPDLNRPKEALENYALETIAYVGALTKDGNPVALFKTSGGAIHQAKVGNYIGHNRGMVTKVTEAAVTVKEIVQDELTGDWNARNIDVVLQE